MPLMKYFGYVGSALLLLIVTIGWCFPLQAMGPGNSDLERPVIRISSAERAPERVIIDTSLPTIVAASNIGPSTSIASAQSAQPLRSAFIDLDVSPKTAALKSSGEAPKPKLTAKREPAKNGSNHRAAKPLNIMPAPQPGLQATAPDSRMSLLETLKERLGQTFFRLN
ncbi:hypothetical protein [Bradyrhizobium canariense]|uniref:hypothetical protein n=1 Tax=Bradyrhizobium canariense TaxID=255045 RepID=UPI001177E009|nr:hypothetical protein [Bradyrhizobium canariense]